MISTKECAHGFSSSLRVALLVIIVSTPGWGQSVQVGENSTQADGSPDAQPSDQETVQLTGRCDPPHDFTGCPAIITDLLVAGTGTIPDGLFIAESKISKNRYIMYPLDVDAPGDGGQGECNPPVDFSGCTLDVPKDAFTGPTLSESPFRLRLSDGRILGVVPVPDQ